MRKDKPGLFYTPRRMNLCNKLIRGNPCIPIAIGSGKRDLSFSSNLDHHTFSSGGQYKPQNKIRVLTSIKEGLSEVRDAKKSEKKLQTLKDFLHESNR